MSDILKGIAKFNLDDVGALAVAIECNQYAREHMNGLPRFTTRRDHLNHAIGVAPTSGLVLEFGVFSGHTLTLIANGFAHQQVYGFDSFEGLPEDWMPGSEKGTFAVGKLPAVPANAELVVGWFDRTLPGFLDAHPGPAALIHVDCDLYSSTQTIFTQLKERIVPGTVIVFDEYWNYPDWKRHEYLAFQEFVAQHRIKYRYISLVPDFEMVAVQII